MKTFKQFTSFRLESFFLDEGVNDPAIFKAIFLAGGPGSGKSYTAGQAAVTAHGFKILGSDQHFEHAMKKAEQEMTPEFISSPTGQQMRDVAKARTGIREERYIKGRLGIVYDGTGHNIKKIIKASNRLRALGYDTGMLFVNTDLETAQVRNLARTRTLDPKVVAQAWNEAQKNLGPYKDHFKSKIIIVDSSNDVDNKAEMMKGYRWAAKFAKSPIENPVAKKWIEMEQERKSKK